MEDYLWWKTTFDGKQPSMEDNLLWKTIFDGRQTSMEDDLQWKTTFDGKQPSMEDKFRWMHPLVEGNLWWKISFWGKTTYNTRQQAWREDSTLLFFSEIIFTLSFATLLLLFFTVYCALQPNTLQFSWAEKREQFLYTGLHRTVPLY